MMFGFELNESSYWVYEVGIVGFDVVWRGAVRFGSVWSAMVWYGMTWPGGLVKLIFA